MRALTFLTIPLLVLNAALAFAAGWPGFVVPDTYSYAMPSGEVTWAATGDLNGDGYPEVVVAQASYLQVWINHNGVLTLGAKYTTGSINRVLVGDINRDGRLDVVAVGNLTAALIGKGDGTFQAPTLSAGLGDDAALGDVNRDGYPDLVVASSIGVQVRLNDRYGNFGAAALVAAVSLSRIAVADFNGDGNGDIVGANGNLVVMLGSGDGTFAAPSTTSATVASFAVGDANRDGFPDIFYAGVGNAGVWLGNGDGSFRQGSEIAIANAKSVSLGDFNSDGMTDIAVSSFAENELGVSVPAGLTLLIGNGDGSFLRNRSYAFAGAQNPAVDMNGDGRPDFVIGGVALAFGNGDGTFRAVEQANTGVQGSRQMVAADFLGDGGLEFAIVGQDEKVRIARRVSSQWSSAIVAGLTGTTIVAGDFDGDGLADLATVGGDGFVAVASGDGNLNFSAAKKSSAGTSNATYLAAGRLNGDRLDDVVVASGGTLQLLLAAGSGYFAPPVGVNLENGDAVEIRIADLNLDGIGDIVVQHDYGFTVLLGDASGKYLDQRGISVAGKIGGFLLQDLNGDAKADLIYTSSVLGKLYVLWGDGAGTFTAGSTYAVITPGDITAGDVNGDGVPDLIVSTNNGGLATLLGTAQHTFLSASYWYANVGQSSPVLAEVTGDGTPDVVTLDASGALSLFSNRGFVQPLSSAVTLSNSVVDFGSQTIRRESGSQTVRLTNTGNVNLQMKLSGAGDFSESDTCGHELRVGAACMATFTFKPMTIGTQSLVLPITAGLSQAMTLQGTGLDVTSVGSRPNRDTRVLPLPPAIAPVVSTAKVRSAPAPPKRAVFPGKRRILARKLPFRHTTW